jgi:predicted  nucleic acid-binding Zn-ribbon protein
MELDQTKKQHDLEMARQRERIESDFKREITQLNKEIQNREMAIDAYKNHAEAAGRKLDEAQRNFDKSIKAMEVKEESRQQQLNDLQRQLEVANSQVEKLSQTREQQRHRILRLTMQAQGELGDDVDTVIRRIIHESGRLANELEAVTTKYRFELEDAASLRKQLDIAQSARVIAETELKRRTTDFRKLTDTFEAYLGVCSFICISHASHIRRSRLR